ncbi:alpha/beta-hydrolase [Phaeosphaeriaceae sp. SRC1lsM3a]|nr:alpha/beta-hydrolase [Stagonospora sp. SRC1lsM3a]
MAGPQINELAPRAAEALLSHQSLNPDKDATIVLIHGAFSDNGDWDLVVPYLDAYHVLLPNSPGHGRSSHLPFSIESAATSIAHLIQEKALNGRAHIVGHSLGASVAVCLATTFPDVVSSLFVSGYHYATFPSGPLTPYLLWTTLRIENIIPRPAIRWAMDGADIRRTRNMSLKLCSEIVGRSRMQLGLWTCRTCVVVASKGGLVPSDDSTEAARRLVSRGTEGGAEVVAYTHPDMRHPWNRQDPRLWAETVMSWIEGGDMPKGFARL